MTVSLTLAGREFLFDPDVAREIQALSERAWSMRGDNLAFQPRLADVAKFPKHLQAERVVPAGLLVRLIRGEGPPRKGHVVVYLDENRANLQRANLEWREMSEIARERLNLPEQMDPNAGIEETKAGTFRVRTWINGAQRALGTHASKEEARRIRDEALAHPERFPRPAKRRGNTPPEARYTLSEALAELAAKTAEIERLQLLIQHLEKSTALLSMKRVDCEQLHRNVELLEAENNVLKQALGHYLNAGLVERG